MKDKQNPLAFIKHFQNEGTIDVFMNGCCYWFAYILMTRFLHEYPMPKIMYNDITGHFATKINGKIYDITGEIEETEQWKIFDDYLIQEPSYSQVIIRDCILKDPNWGITAEETTNEQDTDK